MTHSPASPLNEELLAALRQLAASGNGVAAPDPLLGALERAAIQGPLVSGASSQNDTNIASILIQYNLSVATAADASRKSPYFVELRTPAPLDPAAVAAQERSPFAKATLARIRNWAVARHVVLLSTPPGTPVSALLQAVAVDLKTVLAQHVPAPPPGSPAILEYSPGLDQQDGKEFDLRRQLLALRTPTILVFPEATREHLGWELVALAHLAREHSHYILASVDVTPDQFHLRLDEQVFWRPVELDGLYDASFLELSLVEGLATFQQRLPRSLHGLFRAEDELSTGRTVRDVARELRTPANVIALLQSLANLPREASATEIGACIEVARHADLTSSLRRWYQGLTRREQLLAVGLCLFDKSSETQLFAALQELVNDVWQLRDGLTPILDHLDLTGLRVFFQFVETGPYSVRVESALSHQRHLLLHVALESHRRHLQRALPWLIELIKQSLSRGASKQELYGIDSQRAHLRATIGEALSEVGLLAFDVVQPALLSLVADRRDATHVVLARALASWEARGQGDRLLRTLHQWQHDRQHVSLVQAMLPQNGGVAESAEGLLRAASLLTVTYAIRRSPPGQVTEAYWDLLAQLSSDPSPRVRHYLTDYTLRMLLPAYISGITPLLRTLVLRADQLRLVVCQKLAGAYETCPHEVAQVLRGWRDEGFATPISEVPSRMPDPAEELLAAVIQTLSELPRREVGAPLTLEVRRRLEQQIIRRVRHPMIRVTILTTVLRNAWQDPHALHRFLAEVQESEYERVLQLLTEGYIDQRRTLNERYQPDLVRPVSGQPTPLWWEEHRRPRTESEVMLGVMLARPADPRLRSLAFQAFMAFTERFDAAVNRELSNARQEAERERARLLERRTAEAQAAEGAASAQEQPAQPVPIPRPAHANFYELYLVPLLATREYPQYRETISDLLPLARAYQDDSPSLLHLRLRLWEEGSGGEVATIARCLRSALYLVQLPWWGARHVGLTTLASALMELHEERTLPLGVYVVLVVAGGVMLAAAFLIGATILIGLAS